VTELDSILGTYARIDGHLADRLLGLAATDPAAADASWDRSVNDHAYFVLVVAQFERFVTDRAEAAVRARGSSADEQVRRLAALLQDRVRALSFAERLSIVVDRGSHLYRDVREAYETRNRIAHGTLLDTAIDVTATADMLRTVADSLQDST